MMAATCMRMLAQMGGARAERLRQMHSHFSEPSENVYTSLAVSVLAILAIFAVMKLVERFQSRRQEAPKPRPMALYMRVQSQMGLPLLDRWRLWRLAKSAGLANPACLLISPVLFDRAVEKCTAKAPNSAQAHRLSTIRKRIFGRAETPLANSPIPEELLEVERMR